MPSQPDVGVIIPAAGMGVRAGLGQPKQYKTLAGVPLLLRTIRPFSSHPAVRQIVVALPPDDAAAPPDWIDELTGEALKVSKGGETRAHSVRNALAEMDLSCSVVLVHDAARPFVSRDVIDRLVERVRQGHSCLAAIPMSDTVKRADGKNVVAETVDRSNLWRAQTPQGFPRKILESAYEKAREDLEGITDESSLLERHGFDVELVADDPGNFKLTLPSDFELAERLLR
jgi:2-C-methyl-D-erythritol 4-phosphate cytidylyltransferase